MFESEFEVSATETDVFLITDEVSGEVRTWNTREQAFQDVMGDMFDQSVPGVTTVLGALGTRITSGEPIDEECAFLNVSVERVNQ